MKGAQPFVLCCMPRSSMRGNLQRSLIFCTLGVGSSLYAFPSAIPHLVAIASKIGGAWPASLCAG